MVIVLASPLVRGETITVARHAAGVRGGRRAAGIRLGRRAAGLGVDIALAAAAAGARVELVGKVGDDPAGDAVAVELERAGVGHAALLREPAAETPVEGAGMALTLALALEVADLELALRYLPDFRVIVAADPLPDSVAEVVAEAAGYGGAHRVLIGGRATEDDGVTQLVAPAPGHGAAGHGAFGAFVGRYAAFLDAGQSPADAFATAAREVGWEPAHHA